MNGSILRSAARRWWQRSRRRLGWPGMCGVALLAAALAMAAIMPTLQHAADESRAALEQRRSSLALVPPPPPAPASPNDVLNRYVEAFPPFGQNADDMIKVFEDARRSNVALTKGDYAVKTDAGSPFVSYTATFPVHESYLALKTFAANVLRSSPHAALDELRMARPDAAGAVLDATVRFTFVYRHP